MDIFDILVTIILGMLAFIQLMWLVWLAKIEDKIETLRLRSHNHGRNE